MMLKTKPHRDIDHFVIALDNFSLGSLYEHKESQKVYAAEMKKLKSGLAKHVTNLIKQKDEDVCGTAIRKMSENLTPSARCVTTPRAYFKELTKDIGTSKWPREEWCRVLELWMQMTYEKCDFNNDSYRLHRLVHASTCRIEVDEIHRMIPAHARVEETSSGSDNGNRYLIDNILELLPEIQIAADERLVMGVQNAEESEQARYNDQNKIRHCIDDRMPYFSGLRPRWMSVRSPHEDALSTLDRRQRPGAHHETRTPYYGTGQHGDRAPRLGN